MFRQVERTGVFGVQAVAALVLVGCSDAAIKAIESDDEVRNTEPTASITSHTEGGEYREEERTQLFGRVADADHAAGELVVNWYVDGEAICKAVTPEDDGSTHCETTLEPGDINIVLEVSDPINASGNDAIGITVDPSLPPVVNLIAPFDGDRLVGGEPVEFRGYAMDDEDGIDLVVSLASDLQGPLEITPVLDVDGEFVAYGDLALGRHVITLTAEDSTGKLGVDSHVIEMVPGNTAPTVDDVSLSPARVFTNDEVVVAVSGSDLDGDDVTYGYAWYVNDGLVAETGTSLTGVTDFDKHDRIKVVVTPDDGAVLGEPVATDTLTVRNSPPTAPVVAISTSDATGDLICTVTEGSTDDDEDPIGYTVSWDVDGVPFTDTDTTVYAGDTVGWAALSSSESWTCTVTPNDGEDAGPAGTDTFVVPEPDPCMSLHLDGEGDHVVVGAAEDFVMPDTAMTFESWVQWDGDTTRQWSPIATQGWGDSTMARFFVGVSGADGSSCSGVLGAGYIHVEIHTSYSFGPCFASDTALIPGEWHHVAVVFDVGQGRVYVDGEQAGADTVSDPTLHDALSAPLLLGKMDAGGGFWFGGAMSGTRYSSTARYDADFLPNWPLESDAETLGLWHLDDESTTALDASGREHDGSVVGGEWVETCPSAG